ncbi:hypothetical protein P5673_026141 [Acropora cervicornis]|uniref:Eph LBD domain-containing protein n=1 Tax=Acropora cervicornis TaxID=6130 RepID=A0AAD9Q0X6_ACRCE|nr:hypothetical protein P5673_026141 [Acropora cervicornis]
MIDLWENLEIAQQLRDDRDRIVLIVAGMCTDNNGTEIAEAIKWYHPTGQNTRYSICNPDNPQEPNNWLRSPVIEVGDIQRLDVSFRL